MNVWILLFAVAVVVLVFTLWEYERLRAKRDYLLCCNEVARKNIFPLFDDALYRSIRDWRKKHPRDSSILVLGYSSSCEADRLIRAFYQLGPTAEEEQKLSRRAASISNKLGVAVAIHTER